MKDIKMSDFFELPMNLGYPMFTLGNDKKNQYKESIYVVTAINAYDGNQERIRQLISCGNEFECVIEMQRERIDQLEGDFNIICDENALLENQLKNAQAEIAELKKKAQGY